MRRAGLVLSLTLVGSGTLCGAQQQGLLSGPGESPGVWGALVLPEGPGPHPGLVFLHGSGGWRTGYVDMARVYADSGFAVLVLDYYGETGGAPAQSEAKLRKWEEWRRTVRAAAAFLLSRPQVTKGGIGLVGFSRGAFLAVSSAASTPSVAAVVDFFGGGGGGTISMEDEVRGIPPTLILHGEADTVVPVSFARELRDGIVAVGGEVETHLLPGEGHAFNLKWAGKYSGAADAKSFGLAIGFLRTHLSTRPTPGCPRTRTREREEPRF